MIFASIELLISLSCSIFFSSLSVVFFFNASSCGISSLTIGTICCFCCSVSPSSSESWLSFSVDAG